MYFFYYIFFKPLLKRGYVKPKNNQHSCHITSCVILSLKFVGRLLNLEKKFVSLEVLTAISTSKVKLTFITDHQGPGGGVEL
jgi:hypothetical protein